MKHNSEAIYAFVSLVRLGIGHALFGLPQKLDWNSIQEIASEHGLTAIVLDGIQQLPEVKRPPQELLLQWIGEVLHDYEYRYEQYRRTIAEMAKFYNSHGYKMMVLKGYACSLDWPKPEHRPCGDIDIWQFGDYKKADELLKKERGITVEEDQHHHTIFNWGEFMVENHYDFINVHSHQSSKALEKIFKELGKDDSHCVEVHGEKVYVPSPNLHALFLLRHAASHFAAEGITLRNLLDWAFFMEKHSKEVDWKWLMPIVDEYHMHDFFNCINAICVEELDFNVSIFPSVHFLPDLKDKVFKDILNPEFQHEPPAQLLSRLAFKYRRWKANEWKRMLCFDESGCSNFISGVLAHLIKPKTI